MILQTLRLFIRDFKDYDAVALYKAMECPQVALMYNNEFTSINKVQQYIEVLEKRNMNLAYSGHWH